ncbi:hypothetical protein ACOMHN_048968 [Nucella lapillus]
MLLAGVFAAVSSPPSHPSGALGRHHNVVITRHSDVTGPAASAAAVLSAVGPAAAAARLWPLAGRVSARRVTPGVLAEGVVRVAGHSPEIAGRPAHARSSSSEMLAVGPPLSITTTAAVAPPLPPSPLAVATPFFHDLATPGSPTTTTPSLRSLLPPSRAREGRGGNHSMDVPQGDQPPVPPIKEGPPYRPGHWNQSTHRSLYIKNRYGRYLEMWPNGATQSVPESNSFCKLPGSPGTLASCGYRGSTRSPTGSDTTGWLPHGVC